ncbi:MAG TPA: SGNH/GDSL hydrolase family protein [Puia sp.]|nr:SGNH/GDSL hydrolase family protein [Puia sp.]
MKTILIFCFSRISLISLRSLLILSSLFAPACLTPSVAQTHPSPTHLSRALPSQPLASSANLGFESGLTGWIRTGRSQNIRPDTAHPYQGSTCARLGAGYAALMKRFEVDPLSILRFNAYIRSGTAGVKGYSFMRFYNAAGHLLLEYKSQPLSSTDWQATGNYTETPAGTAYMLIGIEMDSSGTAPGYLYADEFSVETNIGSPRTKKQPLCDLDRYLRPFWLSDTIFNETVLLYSKDGQPATGRLLYTPAEILSVSSFDASTFYQPRADYNLEGNQLIRKPASHMPFRADTSFDKKNLAWYNLQSQWVTVTYTHKDAWTGPVPAYKGDRLPRTMTRLRTHSPLRIVAFGMSITRGLNVSSYDSTPPYMPTYVDLFAYRLKKIYGYSDIKMFNAGLPGSRSDWGAQYADKYINPLHPDLVILDFGMNDFWACEPASFKGYIQTMIRKIRKTNPATEFLLLSNMMFDPDYIQDSDDKKDWYRGNMRGYNKALQELETTGIVDLDMTTLSDTLYHRKAPKDCLANPLHPNDYLARWYAQSLAATLTPSNPSPPARKE